MYYDENGNELKKFNTYDSAGVIFAKKLSPEIIRTNYKRPLPEKIAAEWFQAKSK